MEQTLTVTDINSQDVGLVWPLVEAHLQGALERSTGEYLMEDIIQGLSLGYFRLWVVYDKRKKILASAVCEMREFPRKKICFILLMGGEGMEDWLDSIWAIEDWAKQNGADAVAAYTRPGISKVLKGQGYSSPYIVVQKELTDRRLH